MRGEPVLADQPDAWPGLPQCQLTPCIEYGLREPFSSSRLAAIVAMSVPGKARRAWCSRSYRSERIRAGGNVIAVPVFHRGIAHDVINPNRIRMPIPRSAVLSNTGGHHDEVQPTDP
jgi:hypothetical protein